MEISCTLGSMFKQFVNQSLKYYIFNKPFGVLSQFTKEVPSHITLADYLNVAADVYPVGRLDKDSEGLLLLTNDNKLKTKLLNPSSRKEKTYLVQLEGEISEEAIDDLISGIEISVKSKKYKTLPCTAKKLSNFQYPDRNPPIRYRANIPTSWVEIKLYEGKNRQVRKMCAAVDFPVLRLIRTDFAGIKAESLKVGEYKEINIAKIKF